MRNTTPLRAIIVDDEELARENLRLLLKEYCGQIDVIDTASNIVEAYDVILEKKPQVVFLDIRMPSGIEGFDLLQKFEKRDFQVVFVTAFKDYAIQAFNANAIHYILKPIDIDDLINATKKLVEYQESFFEDNANKVRYQASLDHLSNEIIDDKKTERITLYHAKGFKIIDTKNILRLEAQGNYTTFYFVDGSKYLDSKTLKINEEVLPTSFLRIHKSHLINLDYLSEYSSVDGYFAIMSDGKSVPVSRSRLSEFITKVKSL